MVLIRTDFRTLASQEQKKSLKIKIEPAKLQKPPAPSEKANLSVTVTSSMQTVSSQDIFYDTLFACQLSPCRPRARSKKASRIRLLRWWVFDSLLHGNGMGIGFQIFLRRIEEEVTRHRDKTQCYKIQIGPSSQKQLGEIALSSTYNLKANYLKLSSRGSLSSSWQRC